MALFFNIKDNLDSLLLLLFCNFFLLLIIILRVVLKGIF